MSEKLPVLSTAYAKLKQGSSAANLLRAGVAALALNAVACGDDNPTTEQCYGEHFIPGTNAYTCTCVESEVDDRDVEDSKVTFEKETNLDDTGVPAGCYADAQAHKDQTGANPSCTPTQEVCDGYDNDCDGYIDEGNVCGTGGSPSTPSCTPYPEVCNGKDDDCDGQIDEGCTPSTQNEGFKIYWLQDRPADQTNSASYVPYADQQIQNALNGQLEVKDIKFLNDSPYPEGAVSKAYGAFCLDSYCQGDVEVDPDGMRVGAAVTPDTYSEIPLGYGGFKVNFGGKGPVGLAAVIDSGVKITITNDGTQTPYSYHAPVASNNSPISATSLSASLSPEKKMELSQKATYTEIDMTE